MKAIGLLHYGSIPLNCIIELLHYPRLFIILLCYDNFHLVFLNDHNSLLNQNYQITQSCNYVAPEI
jgi:hypothetical protein